MLWLGYTRLSQVKELARHFLEECDVLTGGFGKLVVDSLTIPHEMKQEQETS